jgi:AcrR family transcriptional regulator
MDTVNEKLMKAKKTKTASQRQRRRLERTRAALRDAARAVLERKGYAQTTLRDILAESDITHPTFYKYFESKEDALADLIDRLVDELVDAAAPFGLSQSENRSGPEPSLRGRVRLGMRAILGVARRNRQLLLAVRQAIHASELHARRWARFRSRALSVLEQDLGWGRRMGLIRCEDTSVLAVAMVATMESALFELAAREDHELPVVESVLESFYWNALFGWRAGPADYVLTRSGSPRPVFATPARGRGSLARRRARS